MNHICQNTGSVSPSSASPLSLPVLNLVPLSDPFCYVTWNLFLLLTSVQILNVVLEVTFTVPPSGDFHHRSFIRSHSSVASNIDDSGKMSKRGI